ncbi:hypothetical protein GFM09_27615 [Rhizobium leguminosarum bv. viciae]|nr:hypothetical protein [Rhizobium leguminosarum bv. viciae]
MPGMLTLRDFKGTVITVECKPCGQQGELDRKALVKQFGASMRFVDLRRRMAMGCDKMHGSDGQDRCGTGFPCLLEAALVFEPQKPTCSLELAKLDCVPKGLETSP